MTPIYDLWRTLRKNLTYRDLYPKRRYPLWTDPVTGLPCRSGPAPLNQQAAPRRKEKVIRESESERESLQARLLARAQVRRCLTETQYRRVAYLFGFDTPELSQRDVAEIEGVYVNAVQKSKRQALDKMRRHSYLWLFWLLCKHFGVYAAYSTEKGEAQLGLYEAEARRGVMASGTRVTPKAVKPDNLPYGRGHQTSLRKHTHDIRALADFGFTITELRPGTDARETDKFTPRSPYDRQVDDLVSDYVAGGLTFLEWRVELVLTHADKQNPDAESDARRKLRQDLEWTFGAEGLGVFSEREREYRVSAALRSYVTGEEISTWAPSARHAGEKAETASLSTERTFEKVGG